MHTFPENGVYNVCLTVTNENGSSKHCETLYLGVSNSSDEEILLSVSLFPNPVEWQALLTITDYFPENAIVNIFNISGMRVYTKPVIHGWNNLDLSLLPVGVYFYSIRERGKSLYSGKLIKE